GEVAVGVVVGCYAIAIPVGIGVPFPVCTLRINLYIEGLVEQTAGVYIILKGHQQHPVQAHMLGPGACIIITNKTGFSTFNQAMFVPGKATIHGNDRRIAVYIILHIGLDMKGLITTYAEGIGCNKDLGKPGGDACLDNLSAGVAGCVGGDRKS